MIDFCVNTYKDFDFARKPVHILKNIDTGHNSKFAYGVATRKVNLGRGGKEGNNAFVKDNVFED